MSRVPRIRFKGFEEDWEQRKLEYYLEVSEERNLSNDYTKENVLSVSGDVGIVNQIEFQGRSFAGMLVNNYGVVKTGYVVYTKSPLKNNPYGIIKANKGRDGIVSTLYAIYKPKLNVNSNFIQIYFEQNARMNNYMQPLVNKGAKNDMKISSGNALKGNVIFPIRKEQDIIVDFFFKIDHLITLHQRKLEKLKIIKRSMLENLFPQNEEKTPKIRFSGFTEDWEQRKHGEVFIYLRNNTLSREELNDEDGFAQSIHYGDVLIKYGECLNVSKELLPYIDNKNIVNKFKKFYIQNGDVIIADTAEDETVGKCIEISGIVDHNVISGLHTIPLRPVNKFAYGYLGFYLNSNSYHNQLKPLMQGIKVTSISKNLLKTTTLNYPSNIQEQKIIGRYFDALNHLITLHQSKLEKLQKIKKSMLESMFV